MITKPLSALFTLIVISLQSALPVAAADATLKSDIQQAITRGLDYLRTQQDKNGFWVTPDDPALSALVVAALKQNPAQKEGEEDATTQRGYDFLMSQVKPDGGIYAKARANYNTSIALMAVTLRMRPEDDQVIRAAYRFVAGQQNDADEPGKTDNPFDGGIGYGEPKPGAPAHADLSNTSFALEALHNAKQLFSDGGRPIDKKDDLNWDAAIQFVSRCQNLPGSNDQAWAGEDKKNIGGFSYTPVPQGDGGKKKQDGPTPMRQYGSISYAGMMSFIYAGLTPEDPRVKAALQWLGENYTVDENPGMGAEGLYYYYHTMAKALSSAKLGTLQTSKGPVNWTDALGRKLIGLQGADGSWANTASGRWMESSPVLVTAYTVLALEHVHHSLK